MKKYLFSIIISLFLTIPTFGQIDLNNLNSRELLGQFVTVENGFSPKFYIGNTKIPKVEKVAEILGLKRNEEINKLFKTFRTGRTVFKVASYAGTAVALY